ncbi:MAG TPA: hypothetical protein V6D27_03540 [Vampirovibrionales bacterium]
MVLSSLEVFLIGLRDRALSVGRRQQHLTSNLIPVSGVMPLWVSLDSRSPVGDRHITIGFYIKSRTRSNSEIKIYPKREKEGSILRT